MEGKEGRGFRAATSGLEDWCFRGTGVCAGPGRFMNGSEIVRPAAGDSPVGVCASVATIPEKILNTTLRMPPSAGAASIGTNYIGGLVS